MTGLWCAYLCKFKGGEGEGVSESKTFKKYYKNLNEKIEKFEMIY